MVIWGPEGGHFGFLGIVRFGRVRFVRFGVHFCQICQIWGVRIVRFERFGVRFVRFGGCKRICPGHKKVTRCRFGVPSMVLGQIWDRFGFKMGREAWLVQVSIWEGMVSRTLAKDAHRERANLGWGPGFSLWRVGY